MSQRRRVAAIALIALLLIAPIVAASGAAVQSQGNESTSNTSASNASSTQPQATVQAGEYPLEDLRQGGEQIEAAPNSVRLLGDTGSVAIRHYPPGPFSQDWMYLQPGQTLNTNRITLYSSRFGDRIEPKEYELVVVYWEEGQRQVKQGNSTTTVPVAENQTIDRHQVTFDKYYDQSNITLRSHYDDAVEATMWLEDPETGDRVSGVQWRFTHKSVPTSEEVDISTRGDALAWLGKNVLLIAIPGMLGCAGGARRILDKTGRGPMLGWMWWLISLTVLTGVLLAGAFITTATVFSRLPQLIGVLLAAIVFVAVLESSGSGRQVMFSRPILTDAKSPSGDDVKDARYEEVAIRSVVRMDDGVFAIVRSGIRPFLARWWASPATIDIEDLKTQIEVQGPIERKYIADPESDEVLKHTPARLVWNPPLIDEEADDLVNQINWGFLVTSAISLGVGWVAGDLLVGIPGLGLLVGAIPIVIMCIEARDGEAEFVPAPIHMTSARATMSYEASEYDDGKTLEKARDRIVTLQAKSERDVEEALESQDRTLVESMYDPDIERAVDPEPQRDRDDDGEGIVIEGGGDD